MDSTPDPASIAPDPVTGDSAAAFLDRYAAAISADDLDAIAECYAYPALAVSPLGRLVIAEPQQTRDFFAQNGERYRAQGIQSVTVRDVETDAAAPSVWVGRAVLVHHDGSGAEVGTERQAYQLVAVDGALRIAVTTPLDAPSG